MQKYRSVTELTAYYKTNLLKIDDESQKKNSWIISA